LQNFQFVDKSTQKSSIFPAKAGFARGLKSEKTQTGYPMLRKGCGMWDRFKVAVQIKACCFLYSYGKNNFLP
jgi:hypothetical protein